MRKGAVASDCLEILDRTPRISRVIRIERVSWLSGCQHFVKSSAYQSPTGSIPPVGSNVLISNVPQPDAAIYLLVRLYGVLDRCTITTVLYVPY